MLNNLQEVNMSTEEPKFCTNCKDKELLYYFDTEVKKEPIIKNYKYVAVINGCFGTYYTKLKSTTIEKCKIEIEKKLKGIVGHSCHKIITKKEFLNRMKPKKFDLKELKTMLPIIKQPLPSLIDNLAIIEAENDKLKGL